MGDTSHAVTHPQGRCEEPFFSRAWNRHSTSLLELSRGLGDRLQQGVTLVVIPVVPEGQFQMALQGRKSVQLQAMVRDLREGDSAA